MVGSEMLSDVLTALDGFSDKMGATMSRLERLEAKDGGAPPRKCWFCNSTEHLAEACQSPKALAARAAKAKRDEAREVGRRRQRSCRIARQRRQPRPKSCSRTRGERG